MIAIVHSIYSQSMHAQALNAGSMDNDAGRYCTSVYVAFLDASKVFDKISHWTLFKKLID